MAGAAVTAGGGGGLDDARDPAAVLYSRLGRATPGGPLPWLDGVSDQLAGSPEFGPYLQARVDLIRELSLAVRKQCAQRPQPWLEELPAALNPELVAQIAVWRAAQGVPEDDLRPTGSAQPTEVWETVTSPRLVGRPEHLPPLGHRPPSPGIGF